LLDLSLALSRDAVMQYVISSPRMKDAAFVMNLLFEILYIVLTCGPEEIPTSKVYPRANVPEVNEQSDDLAIVVLKVASLIIW